MREVETGPTCTLQEKTVCWSIYFQVYFCTYERMLDVHRCLDLSVDL